MGIMHGPGDVATWPTTISPRDPRYDDSAEMAESEAIVDAIKRIRTHLNHAETAAGALRLNEAHAAIERAIDELQELSP